MPGSLKAKDLKKLGLLDASVQTTARRACREAARRGDGRDGCPARLLEERTARGVVHRVFLYRNGETY